MKIILPEYNFLLDSIRRVSVESASMTQQQPEQLNLGDVIYKWRAMSRLSVRGAAPILGLSAASISRIENGEMVPDGKNLMKIFNWLMKPTGDKQ